MAAIKDKGLKTTARKKTSAAHETQWDRATNKDPYNMWHQGACHHGNYGLHQYYGKITNGNLIW